MQVSCYTMAYRARHHIDPSMTVRQLRPDDHDYKPLACLYTAYSWYDKITRSVSSTHILAHWHCKYYDPERYRCIVKVQAMVRGWLFCHRVLYNPHTKIGQRFLMYKAGSISNSRALPNQLCSAHYCDVGWSRHAALCVDNMVH